MKIAKFSALLVVALVAAAPHSPAADNVILFIGDGMGVGHIKAGRALVNGDTSVPLNLEKLGYSGQLVTTLPNGTIVDSASAATALATGFQPEWNGVLSLGPGNTIKTTILEFARAKGMRTGIITTDEIGGATPAAFGAHEPSRTLLDQIRSDYFYPDTTYHHPPSHPDLLLGGGFNDPNTSYVEGALALGYSFVSTRDELASTSASRLLGLFTSYWQPMASMANRTPATLQPTLSEMVSKALKLLPRDPNPGFFLMVESANIDKLSHAWQASFAYEVAELDVAVQIALDWKNLHPADNTLILVTADHETGGLTVPDQSITPGTLPTMSWTSFGHSAAAVPLYATAPASLAGLRLENEEVFFLAEDGINASRGGKPPVLTDLTLAELTPTNAVLTWHTLEPSDSRLLIAGSQVAASSARTTSHRLALHSLSPATPYQVVAKSFDLIGLAGSAHLSFTTGYYLIAPARLNAFSARSGLALSWDDTNNAETHYQVLRCTSQYGPYKPLAVLPPNFTSFLDRSAVHGTRYFYQVRALRNSRFGVEAGAVTSGTYIR